jgi:tellurite resistance protein TehA-like permease
MSLTRLVVTVVVLAMLVTELARPAPVRADTGTDLAIAGAVTAAYVGIVLIATAVHRSSRGTFLMPGETEQFRKPDQRDVHFGARCRQNSSAFTLACW